MSILKSFGLPLVACAITLGSAGIGRADVPTLTKMLADAVDATKSFAQLAHEREEAKAVLTRAQAELDIVSKMSPKATDDIAKIQKRIDDANAAIRHIDQLIESKKRAFNESAAKAVQARANAPQSGTSSNQPGARPGQSGANGGQQGSNSDLGAELEKLAADRVKAEAELAKAKADLDALKKQDPKLREKTEALKKQIEDAQRRIKHANDILGPVPKTLTYKATTPEEVQQAPQLPQKLKSLLDPILSPYRLNDSLSIEGKFNPITKEGAIILHWKGNP